MASYYGFPECVKVLLENGACVNYRSNTQQTALHKAVGSGSPETVRVLVDAGADVDARSIGDLSALDLARSIKNEECISILEKAGYMVICVEYFYPSIK
jgi:ankyrin repeat protein